MQYYKIFNKDTLIGIATSQNFLTYQEQNNLLVITDEDRGQFVEYKGTLYRDTWMKPLPSREYVYTSALVYEIEKLEYDLLEESIEKNEEIQIIIPNPVPQVIIPATQNVTLDFVRESKLNEMSHACRTTIENGFDLELRNEVKHFSLDTQDQLNLITLNAMADTEDAIPYHADGEECVFYTAAEIKKIVAAANNFKIYQTTYYNALKAYINSLETIEDIAAVEYGMTIPEEYQTEVLKSL